MAEHAEPVRLKLDDSFAGRMYNAVEAARFYNALLAAQQATWEPHDWEDFKCPPSA